jgi:tetratricopeptide (TPR) repeat protein
VSPRARVLAVTFLVALLAASLAVVISHGQRGPAGRAAGTAQEPLTGAPPLVLDLGIRVDREAQALRRASALYEKGRRREAAGIFTRYRSLEARVGLALAQWPTRTLDRLEQLGGLHARSGVVQLHLGLARLWSQRLNWQEALEGAVDVAPDTRYAVVAGNVIFREGFLPDLPLFVPSAEPPERIVGLSAPRQLAVLRELASSGDRVGSLYYGIALQSLGRRLSAAAVFRRVASRRPRDAEAQTAAAFARFDKERPAEAFSRLGPLTRRFPKAATVRFHLGLLLLWSKQLPAAKRQLRLAIRVEPGSAPAREAAEYLERLPRAGGSE